MTLDELRSKHRDDILRITSQYGIGNVRVFGSYARGEATQGSDLDLLVTLPDKIGWGYAGCGLELEDALQIKVDLISDRAIHPLMRNDILSEAKPL